MQAELLILSLTLQAISEFVRDNREEINTMTPAEFRALSDQLAADRRAIVEKYRANQK